MADWKLIALDMDGTLLGKELQVSDENRLWIARARERGIQATLATGRLRRKLVLDAVRLLDIQVPIVTVNGGEVWGADGTLLDRQPLTLDDFDYLRDVARHYRLRFWASPTSGEPVQTETLPNDYDRMTWLKFGIYTETVEMTRALRILLQDQERFEITNSAPLNLEVNPRGVTKASGLARVCAEIGVRPDQVVVIGDSLNDIPMFEWAGLSIAMGNAQDEVKAIADYVTADHLHDGVARAIERVLSMP